MKKIAFFLHNFTGGGAERVTINLANELSSRGYKVGIFVIEKSGVLEETINKDIDIVSFNIKKKSKILKNAFNIIYLKKMIESQEYDYLISVTAPMNLIAAIANSLSKKNIKLYGTIHSMISLENRKFKKLRYRLLKIFDKYIEKTIVVSNEAEEDYIKTIGISKKKTVTIYNPVISEEVFKLQTEKCDHKWLNKNRDYKVIISAGRLNEAKDFPTLLKSIAIARKKQDIRLIILGEGELRNELEKLIQQLNIRESVELLGFDNNPYKYFYNSDLFVLSSKREGLPTVLIEALACGIRVVSTNCKSGPYEILKGGEYGRLVTVGDEVELANNILDALDSEVNKELYITRALDFSIDNAVDNYLNLIT